MKKWKLFYYNMFNVFLFYSCSKDEFIEKNFKEKEFVIGLNIKKNPNSRTSNYEIENGELVVSEGINSTSEQTFTGSYNGEGTFNFGLAQCSSYQLIELNIYDSSSSLIIIH
jgi:hypothetical protein